MAVWIRNLKARMNDRMVLLLHGNVRDKYIDEHGRVFGNLTELLTDMANASPLGFSEAVFYDIVGQERRVPIHKRAPSKGKHAPTTGDSELDATAPTPPSGGQTRRVEPTRVLAGWQEELRQQDANRMAVLFYLDKLVAYKASYQDQESEIILRLEKLIENITPNNRLVLVALQDTLIPTELYNNSPKTYVLPAAGPTTSDRNSYLKRQLPADKQGANGRNVALVANLTDGLFLRDLDKIVEAVKAAAQPSERDLRRIVNQYRIGEQEDYWGALDIEKIENAPKWFQAEGGIKGQNEAVLKVRDMLVLARAGLSGVASGAASKPKGVLFFAGPTGVGKTLVAKVLSRFLFEQEDAFLRYDMSEYKEEHTVSKLIGSPPGYVGSERGGTLTNAVREKPFSVILFDEIEKAHPKIMDIFLQILDEGRLTDSRGQTVFFTETAIVFTSNLGTRSADSRGHPVEERKRLDIILDDAALPDEAKKEKVRAHFRQCVESFFMSEISRPELLNRIGNNIIPFNFILTADVQEQIIRSHFERIASEVEDRFRADGVTLSFEGNLAAWLVEKHGKRIGAFGGRGITNAVESEVMLPIAKAILRAEHEGCRTAAFQVGLNPGRTHVVARRT